MGNELTVSGGTNSAPITNAPAATGWKDKLFGWFRPGSPAETPRARPAGTESAEVNNSISNVLRGFAMSGLNISTNISAGRFLQASNSFRFNSKELNEHFATALQQERRYNAPVNFGGKETFMQIHLSNVKGPVLVRTAKVVEPSFNTGLAGEGNNSAFVFFTKYCNGCKEKTITSPDAAINRAKKFLKDVGLTDLKFKGEQAHSSLDISPVRSVARSSIPSVDFEKVKPYFKNLEKDPNADILVFWILDAEKMNKLDIGEATKKLFQEDGAPLYWEVKCFKSGESPEDPTVGVTVYVLPDGKVIGFGNYTGWNQEIEKKAKTEPR